MMKKQKDDGISRRAFVRNTAAATAGLTIFPGHVTEGLAAAQDMKAQIPNEMVIQRNGSTDPFDPLYHLTPPENQHMHDPTGFCQWKGKYHLFYLSNEGNGHAISDDMVNWRHLPVVKQIHGGWTGAIVTTETEALMSHADFEAVYLARSRDPMLLEWENRKIIPKNSLPDFLDHLGRLFVADTYFWQEGDQWLMLIRKHHWEPELNGRPSFITGGPPIAMLFRSQDLENWKPDGVFYEKKTSIEPGDDAACPNFLPISNDRHIFIHYTHSRGPMYSTGLYDRNNGKFEAEYHGQFSYGPTLHGSIHAPTAFVDSKGRLIVIFNVVSRKRMMSLPRILVLRDGYANPPGVKNNDALKRNYFNPLMIQPIPEMESLRFNPVKVGAKDIPANAETVLPGVEGKAIEIEAVIDPKKAKEVCLNVWRSPDGAEKTTIRFYASGHARASQARWLSIDVSNASLSPERSRIPEIGPLWLESEEPLRLRVFLDRSIIEVFANERQCLSVCAFPSRQDSKGVSFSAKGSEARLLSFKAWQMRSIWPELKAMEGE